MLFFAFIFCAIAINTVSAKIGYFWHITDVHYDANYAAAGDYAQSCKRSMVDQELMTIETTPTGGGRLGDYRCDSPWTLVHSAAKAMKEKHGDNIEFVLWSGDFVSSDVEYSNARALAIQNVTSLLIHTFSSQFVFPVLGHDDPGVLKGQKIGYIELGNYWRQWLPTDAIQTFNKDNVQEKFEKMKHCKDFLKMTNHPFNRF